MLAVEINDVDIFIKIARAMGVNEENLSDNALEKIYQLNSGGWDLKFCDFENYEDRYHEIDGDTYNDYFEEYEDMEVHQIGAWEFLVIDETI